MDIAIIGLGPYGLCVLATFLEYLYSNTRSSSVAPKPTVHIIEPFIPGPGVHSVDLPAYLLLNTACEQLDLNPISDLKISNKKRYHDFLGWLRANNAVYDESGNVQFDGNGKNISSGKFLPRSVFGLYLRDFFNHLVRSYGEVANILHHQTLAKAIERVENKERIFIEERYLDVDHVFITVGHVENHIEYDRSDCDYINPYPVVDLLKEPKAGERVGIAGIGLVAIDVLTALTVGRGGRYENVEGEGDMKYLRSGQEPVIYLFSRSGRPFCCRPDQSRDRTGSYIPCLFTFDNIHALKLKSKGAIKFEEQLLPLLVAEMTIAYYCSCAARIDPIQEVEVRNRLISSWSDGTFFSCTGELSQRYGRCNLQEVLIPHRTAFDCSSDYETWFSQVLVDDVRESEKGEAQSSRKQALELIRTLRDEIRYAVEFNGLDTRSLKIFYSQYVSLFNSIVVGPPVQRGRELIALIEAGVVSLPFGPSPKVGRDNLNKGWVIESTSLIDPTSLEIDYIIRGYVDMPRLDRSKSELIYQLRKSGRIRLHEAASGGVDVDRYGSPINSQGVPELKMTILGPVTEGCRYFTHYVPSPGSRSRAFRDAASAIHRLMSTKYHQS